MDTFNFSEVKKLLSPGKKILLTSHANPDGDAVGSILAMLHFLNQMNLPTVALLPNRFPEFLHWMPGQEKIKYIDGNEKEAENLFLDSDIIFSLDYNAPSRLDNAGKFLIKSKAVKILIDHHIKPEIQYFDHILSEIAISSTSELVYQFISEINPELINRAVAECIYVGILTDTGSFSYNCNFSKTFITVSKLIEKGIDTAAINRYVYDTNTEDRLRLLGYSLSEKMEVIKEYNTAIISLSQEELKRYNNKIGDTEGLVNYALSVKGIRFAAFFRETKNKVRISFRSIGEFSVNEFARSHFEGGGHKNAAGGDSYVSMEKTIEKFKRLLPEYKNQLS
ncbi:MAG: DHH family phosphoesterase [Bacteroidales bacterium]